MKLALQSKVTSIAADAARLLEQAGRSYGPIRVGVDVVSISDFEATMETKGGAAFIRTRFTEAEQDYCDGCPERFAARWAAKEAVAKAVGSGFRSLRPRQIEIVHQPWGEPTVSRVGEEEWPSGADRWRWSLSLAHDGDAAVAVAVAVADEGPIDSREDSASREPRSMNQHRNHPVPREGRNP